MSDNTNMHAIERRNPSRFNVVTGLSEREPYNVVDLGWPGSWPACVRRLLFFFWYPLRWLSASGRFVGARFHTLSYYTLRTRRTFERRFHLTEGDAEHLGDVAAPFVLGQFSDHRRTGIRARDGSRITPRQAIEELHFAKDMTYLVIRGMPTVTPLFRFSRDDEIPEKHRDSEALRSRLNVTSTQGEVDSGYEARSAEALRRKREALDGRFLHADYMMAGLAEILDCKIGPRQSNDPLARNVLTDPSEQQSSDLNTIDMPLRFHQHTVEKPLPDNIRLGKNEACAYTALLCVKNLLRVPIYVVPVKEVVDRLSQYEPEQREMVLSQLSTGVFDSAAPRYNANQRIAKVTDRGSKGLILRRNFLRDGDWIMSFDPERVTTTDDRADDAVVALRDAVRRARRDAIRIELKPGDVLIVDNFRAMVSRREYFPSKKRDIFRVLLSFLWRSVRDRPDPRDKTATIRTVHWRWGRPHRWLRSYYFFRLRPVPADDA